MKCLDAELLDKLPEKYRDKLCFVGSDTGKRHEVTVDPEDIREVSKNSSGGGIPAIGRHNCYRLSGSRSIRAGLHAYFDR